MRKLSILGSTGSIGTQTLEVCRNNPNDFEVMGLCCGSNIGLLYDQIMEFRPLVASVDSEEKAIQLKGMLSSDIRTEILSGHEGTMAVATLAEADTVVGAMVGISGLEPTYHAIKAGKDIALANKETLVTGGDVIMPSTVSIARSGSVSGVRREKISTGYSSLLQAVLSEVRAEKTLRKLLLRKPSLILHGRWAVR